MTRTLSPRPRRAKSKIINKARWTGYAAAAAATVVAGHEAAEAAIVHVDLPDILVKAPVGGPGPHVASVSLDLNGDTVPDVYFSHSGTASGAVGAAFASATSNTLGPNMVAGFIGPPVGTSLGGSRSFPYVLNLGASSVVSSSAPMFLAGPGTMAFAGGYTNSQFQSPGAGFVGVKFSSAAGTHNGWIRVVMSGTPENSLSITDWAYAMPGEPIHVGTVPEPGSLGLLAFGAAGLLAWRKKRLQVAVEKAEESA